MVCQLMVINETSHDSVVLKKDPESFEVCRLMVTNERQITRYVSSKLIKVGLILKH